MNVGFDGQDGHNSHVCFKASMVTITMSVSMVRTVTIAMSVLMARIVMIAMLVSRPVYS